MDESAHVLSGMHSLMVGGGGEGIGRAVTRALAAGGSAVAVADIDGDRADEAASEVTAAGGRAASLTGDARSRADVEGLVQRATDELGRPDIFVTVVVACGAIDTPVARGAGAGAPDWEPMDRGDDASEVAAAVCSSRSGRRPPCRVSAWCSTAVRSRPDRSRCGPPDDDPTDEVAPVRR